MGRIVRNYLPNKKRACAIIAISESIKCSLPYFMTMTIVHQQHPKNQWKMIRNELRIKFNNFEAKNKWDENETQDLQDLVKCSATVQVEKNILMTD